MKNLCTFGRLIQSRSLSIYLPVLMMLVPLAAFSQNPKIDSLRSLLADQTYTDYNDVLYEMSVELMIAGEYDSARQYVTRLCLNGRREGDSLEIVRGTAIKASILRRSGQLDSAKYLYNLLLPITRRKGYSDQSKNILNSLGNIYILEARYDIALKYHYESLEIRESLGDKFEISIALTNIGVAYYKILNPDRALAYYDRALNLKREINNTFDLDILLLNIALCHTARGDFATARKFIDEAFSVCNNDCSDHFLTTAFLHLGLTSFEEGNFSESEEYLVKSFSLAKRNEDIRFQFDNISLLTEIYIKRNQITLAEKYLEEAEKLTDTDGRYRRELSEIYFQFAQLYNKSKDLKRKVYFQDKYIALRDSIFNEEVTANLMKAESGYIERESRARIEAQNKIMALNNEIMVRQRIANVAIGVVALFGILLAIMFARRNKAKQLANRILDEKVTERTRELQINQDALERAWNERDLLIHRVSTDIQSSIATIKGLCFLGQHEVDHAKMEDYWTRIGSTSERLSSIFHRLSHHKQIGGHIGEIVQKEELKMGQ